ncbi:protein argonaute 3-like [Nylanderia fulva]|uniref:protein argonaute 3-like n=1 Tax=Nylanderia fulva TaxID=613905 RepID=UPI0010FAE736|nr:protein argonaute 3-like [Nylanderia fulva]
MLKHVILLSIAMFCLVQSQRPWHAGSSNSRLPQVLPQYIDERIAAEQAAQAGIGNQGQMGTVSQGQPGIAIQGQPGIGIQGQPGFGIQGQPSFASQPGIAIQGQPGTASQGQAGAASQGQAGPINQTGQGTQAALGTDLLGNRIGGSTIAPASAAAAPALSPIIPSDLPVDAHGDIDLVNRIKTWPRDKQPFWYINWQAIQAHRGDGNNSAQPAQMQPNPTSFFAG